MYLDSHRIILSNILLIFFFWYLLINICIVYVYHSALHIVHILHYAIYVKVSTSIWLNNSNINSLFEYINIFSHSFGNNKHSHIIGRARSNCRKWIDNIIQRVIWLCGYCFANNWFQVDSWWCCYCYFITQTSVEFILVFRSELSCQTIFVSQASGFQKFYRPEEKI